jgi:hypothetical protein
MSLSAALALGGLELAIGINLAKPLGRETFASCARVGERIVPAGRCESAQPTYPPRIVLRGKHVLLDSDVHEALRNLRSEPLVQSIARHEAPAAGPEDNGWKHAELN